MTDLNAKVQALREAVGKMTPGPWVRDGKCVGVAHEGEDHRAGTLLRPVANTHWNPKNVTGVLALRNDAMAVIDALQARLAEVERAGRLALDEMRNTVAPRESFTGAVDALDAALSSDVPANPSAL